MVNECHSPDMNLRLNMYLALGPNCKRCPLNHYDVFEVITVGAISTAGFVHKHLLREGSIHVSQTIRNKTVAW